MPGRIEFEFRVAREAAAPRPRRQEDDPFRILVIGDFRGDRERSEEPGLEGRAVVPVDIDNFERVIRRVAPRLSLSGDGPDAVTEEISFTGLDDFHPDALFTRLESFADLRRLRERLLAGESFEAAAATLASDAVDLPAPAAPGEQSNEEAAAASGTMFERLLGGRPVSAGDRTPASRGEGYVAQLIERLIEPDIERGADPDRQRLMIAAVDDTIAGRMRAILHEPRFQELEAAWRGVWWLVSGLETDAGLQICLLDASRQDLEADMKRGGAAIEDTALYRRLVGRDSDTPGGSAWSLLVCLGRFGASDADLRLLAALGAVASHAGGPVVAEADPALLGTSRFADQPDPADWIRPDDESEERWQALRRSSVAPWIGLVLPRVLLRLPYGGRSDPVEHFAFEELAHGPGHESFLWGSPGIACALRLGQLFAEHGWDMEPGAGLELDDLPAFTFTEDGETTLKPCAEALLSHRTADAIMARGIMPVLSHRDRNTVRFARIQSVADPVAPLSGPWR